MLPNLPPDGAAVAALVSVQPERHRRRPFSYHDVRDLRPVDRAQDLVGRARPGERLVLGHLHRTGANIENKRKPRPLPSRATWSTEVLPTYMMGVSEWHDGEHDGRDPRHER